MIQDLNEEAVVRLAGDDGGTALAALHDEIVIFEDEFAFGIIDGVAIEAMLGEDRRDFRERVL